MSSLRVLVTRPLPKGQALHELLVAVGCDSVLWPCLEIQSVDPVPVIVSVQVIEPQDAVIFVSPNAVEYTWQVLDEPLQQKLQNMPVYAVGKGTAHALLKRGVRQVLFPEGQSNSEALLSLPEMNNLQSKTVWICRGDKGRELIAETLTQQGAKVHYITSYRTTMPHSNSLDLINAWKQRPFDLVVLTSQEALENLINLLGKELTLLQNTAITIMSERMNQFAARHGIKKTYLLPGGDNAAIVQFIKQIANKLY